MSCHVQLPCYVQGPGELERLPAHVADFGKRGVAIIDTEVRRLLGGRIENAFSSAGMPLQLLEPQGDVTHATIAKLRQCAGEEPAAVVLGIGGGKALDCGKGVAMAMGLPYLSVPTIASNDAPASSVIALYDDAHRLSEVVQMPHGPARVVVDSGVIAAAPPRFLRAGIGDALSKTFEAQACLAGGGRTIRGLPPSQSGLALAEAAYRILRSHAADALEVAGTGQVNEALEAVLEATILLSAAGFENGGLSIAHAVARGLSGIPEASASLHGEQVAYGLLVQLALENRTDDFLADLRCFYRTVGLPLNLNGIGFRQAGPEQMQAVALASMQGPNIRHFPRALTTIDLVQAMQQVERASNNMKGTSA